MEKIKKIGMIGVDSGRIIVADPTYLDKPRQFPEYNKLPITSDKRRFAQLRNKRGIKTAIIAESGIGDGEYPVYAVMGNIGDKRFGKRVKKVIIDFDTEKYIKLKRVI